MIKIPKCISSLQFNLSVQASAPTASLPGPPLLHGGQGAAADCSASAWELTGSQAAVHQAWSPPPGPRASLSPGFATVARPDVGCSEGVHRGSLKSIQGTVVSTVSSGCIAVSYTVPSVWNSLIYLSLEYLYKMKGYYSGNNTVRMGG